MSCPVTKAVARSNVADAPKYRAGRLRMCFRDLLRIDVARPAHDVVVHGSILPAGATAVEQFLKHHLDENKNL